MSEVILTKDGWRHGVVADIANINPTTTVSHLSLNTPVSFLSMADVSEDGRILNRQSRSFAAVRNGFTRFQENDVLFAKITPCMENGKGAFATGLDNQTGFGSTEFHVLRANAKGDSEFVYHLSQNNELRKAAVSFFSGSAGQQRVSQDFFQRFNVHLPPLPEQRKIASILTTVDSLIEQTEALIEKYRRVKQGMMADLLSRGVDSDGKLRPTQQQAPQLYKESELGWIPKEWKVEKLADCTSTLVTYGIVQAGPHIDGGVPYIRTGDMSGNRLDREKMQCTSRALANSYKRSEVRTGEIVCAIRATIGKFLEVPPELDGANLTQGTARIAPKSDLNNHYLLWALRSTPVQRQIDLTTKGTTFFEITLTDLREIPVAIPKERSEQDHIAVVLDSCDMKVEQESNHLVKLRTLKTGLMQDLLTGKVRVKIDENKEIMTHAG